MTTAAGPLTTGHRPGEIIPLPVAAVRFYKGAAAAVLLGVGFGTPLVPTNPLHQFKGVWAETYDNTAGTAGGYYTRILQRGLFSFSQTGTTITAASISEPVYFADDNTVTLTPGTTYAGIVSTVDSNGNVWVDIEQAVRSSPDSGRNVLALSGTTDAISSHAAATYVITTAGVDAMTLAAPTAGIDDGTRIVVTSDTSNAHTITATGLLHTGTASVNVATFAAQKGAGLTLMAYNGKWKVLAAVGTTFS